MTNYESLFGTPERAAKTIAASMYTHIADDTVASIALSRPDCYVDLAKRVMGPIEEWMLGWLERDDETRAGGKR